MKLIYLAGPYGQPDPCVNVHKHILVADHLAALGYGVMVPVLSHLWHTVSPHPREFWMTLDLCLLERCDALLRLDGESHGADEEVAHAQSRGIPVFYTIYDLESAMPPQS